MRLTFRAKLLAIVGTAASAFIVLIVASTLIARRTDQQVASIRDHYVPKVDLLPRLEGQFERTQRSLQDAVAAHDPEALAKTRAIADQFSAQLDSAQNVISPSDAAALRGVFEDYYGRGFDVSRRLIGGETGESLVASIALMQEKQARTLELLRKAASFDHTEMSQAFDAAVRTQMIASRIRISISIACLVLVLALSLIISRDVLRAVAKLTAGLERFGKGEFEQPITGIENDEIGDVAKGANKMAENLRRLAAERDHADWLKSGQVELARALQGAAEPGEVASSAIRVLTRRLDAPAAALYYIDPDGSLRPLAHHARSSTADDAAVAPSFRPGEGLVGQAALSEDLVVVRNPPADYLRVRSALGDGLPRAIVLLPLADAGRVVGVLELALFQDWSERYSELLLSVRETITIAVEVAQARTAKRLLLTETQQQAQRLLAQEEELRQTNEELQAQQEELRQTNEELSEQAEELETQRAMLEQRNADLDEARRGLERKADELTTVSAYKSQFLTNMSHELRTPLNSMLLLSDLLGENVAGNLTAKQVEYARTIHSAGSDLLGLINEVLDLAKVEAGKQEIHVVAVELRPILQHIERVFDPLARKKGLALHVEVDSKVPADISTDRQRLEQIIRNLLGNAIKFTDRGSVTLRVFLPTQDLRTSRNELSAGELIAFSVTDTGIGIAPAHQERIFAPFEQVEAAADRRHGGTGLGLAITRELAVLLGGDLEVKSAVGEGSTFTCFLPRRSVPQETADEPLTEAPQIIPALGPAISNGHGDPCVLIIEDDRVFSNALCEVIEAQGFRHLTATDGRSGLEMARKHHPTGIVLDVKLPGLDGWKVMEALRADPVTASIPVHFISAVDAVARGLAMGAVGYLTKPAARQDLMRVVQSLAPKRAEQPCRVLVVEDDILFGDSLVKQLADEHMDVRRTTTAAQTLEAVKREHIDCMILDLSLPDTDGLELLQALEKQCGADRPGVVVYTARSLTKVETRRLESYAEAIVLKDGSSSERLLHEIRLFIRRLKDGLGSRRTVAPPPAIADLRLQGKKILLVDDDMRTVYALSATLHAKGAEVIVADTGRAALESLAEHPDVHAVLMDIMMPEMDGYEAMRRIRSDARFATLPIIALTAKAMQGDAEKCIEAGASDYMSKPIDAEQLIALLSARVS